MNFKDKVVIVTGASSGIGAAIAIEFAAQKAKVVIVARTESKLKEVSAKCEKRGPKPLMIIADVSKNSDVKNIISTTVSQCGKIDVLINNAGILGSAVIWEEKAMEVYDKIMATNLRSAVYLTNLAAPHLIQSKGNVVNISSIASTAIMIKGQSAYCISKAGLDHFSRAAALDLGPKGVRVNTVNPGPVQTDMIRSSNFPVQNDNLWEDITNSTILKRLSAPEEIVDLVLFVASDKAKAITGSSLVSDNGMLLNRDIAFTI